MNVALIHDWLVGMRGGEKCLEAFCELFPEATLYTLVYDPDRVSPLIRRMEIRTAFIQRLPAARTAYRRYLPLFPLAVEQFDLRGYDLVLSSSHCVAKGVITQPKTCHVCFCHTPMRYIWDQYWDYFGAGRAGRLTRLVMPVVAHYLRIWDVTSAYRVDYFIAPSHHVSRRIRKHYRRPAEVIHSPVDVDFFDYRLANPLQDNHLVAGDYFLVVSALARYKRVDLAVQAFNRLGLPLVVIGDGPERQRLEQMAKPHIRFLGHLSENARLRDYYTHCKALVVPGEEDFGIVPLEAQACGRPVIAYGKGGIVDSVVPIQEDNPALKGSGVFFTPQSVDALCQAVDAFSGHPFVAPSVRAHAEQFSRARFKARMQALLAEKLTDHRRHYAGKGSQKIMHYTAPQKIL